MQINSTVYCINRFDFARRYYFTRAQMGTKHAEIIIIATRNLLSGSKSYNIKYHLQTKQMPIDEVSTTACMKRY